jgi:ribosome biogenesis GTPase
VVRLARSEELSRIADVERAVAERRTVGTTEPSADDAPRPLGLLAERLAQGALWVAVADDVVVGFALAGERDGRAWLERVAVLPEHARRGLDGSLVDEALLWALREGHGELSATAVRGSTLDTALRERHGFHAAAEEASDTTATTERAGARPAPDTSPLVLHRPLGPETLAPWGWDDWFADRRLAASDPRGSVLAPARVVLESRGILDVVTAAGLLEARVAGRLKRASTDEQPAIGDWVLLRLPERRSEHGLVEAVIERRSKLSRKVAGARTEEQVLAANVDRVFVVMGLDGDFNLRRLERFLITARRSGAQPVVVLNKSDLASNLDDQVATTRRVAGTAPVHVTAAKVESGIEELRGYLVPGVTIALVGSSGVGKSTLLNRLYGETIMRTRKVRDADDRGQHTTTHRQLVRLPNGCLLVDNPGIRELQLWDSQEGVEETFTDVEELAGRCRFRDCEHAGEPGCAVSAAAETGELDPARLQSYQKYVAELRALERRQDEAARLAEKQRWKSIHKALKKHKPRGW